MNTNCSLVSVADILLVDDNPDNLRLLSAMLSEHGYKIRKAINGSLALRAVEIAKPDLILLDINMPDIKGYEVCAQLKSSPQTADIPVIFISAFNQVLDKVKGFEVGGVDYISKPFDIQEVLVRVKNQLILRCQQKQLEEQNAQLQLLVTTTKAINEADDFEAAIKATLYQVCEKIGWNFGEFWIPNPDGTSFDYGKGWYASESCFEEFGYQSEKLIFTNNWTIPSKIYHSKQFLWLSNVSVEQGEVFLRSQLAKKSD